MILPMATLSTPIFCIVKNIKVVESIDGIFHSHKSFLGMIVVFDVTAGPITVFGIEKSMVRAYNLERLIEDMYFGKNIV